MLRHIKTSNLICSSVYNIHF